VVTLAGLTLSCRWLARGTGGRPWHLAEWRRHVDDLPDLVDRAIDVAPLPSHVHIGLVGLPAVTDGVPTRPSGLGQQRREPQHPAVDRDVIDLDPTLGQQLFDVAVGQPKA
jgi:hypothetical protein